MTNNFTASPSSNLTADPVVVGRIVGLGGTTAFQAGLDGQSTANFVNVITNLGVNNRFAFDSQALQQINGGALSNGLHTLHLQALDAQGNLVSSFDFTFRLDTQLPALYLSSSAMDVDTNRSGLQVPEGSRIPLRSGAFDAVQVGKLELLLNGQVIDTGNVFPWEDFVVRAPPFSAGSNLVTFQTRAADSAGNAALSTTLLVEIVPDRIPPAVVSVDPTNNTIITSNTLPVLVRFTEPLDPLTVNATNIVLIGAGPNGVFGDGDDVAVPPAGFVVGEDDPFLELDFANLAFRTYELRIATNGVADAAGNALTNELRTQFQIVGFTTLVGSVQRTNGSAVAGATVVAPGLGRSGVTGSDGRFSITGVPAWQSVNGVYAQATTNPPLFGYIQGIPFRQGSVTDVGVVTVRTLCELVPNNCLDSDGDGIPNSVESSLGFSASNRDSNGNGVPDGLEDCDGDGIPNSAEIVLGANPQLGDADRDGLSDLEELFIYGTNPNDSDTDSDGWPDNFEIAARTDPSIPASHPAQRLSVATAPVTVFNVPPPEPLTNQFLATPIVSYENQ